MESQISFFALLISFSNNLRKNKERVFNACGGVVGAEHGSEPNYCSPKLLLLLLLGLLCEGAALPKLDPASPVLDARWLRCSPHVPLFHKAPGHQYKGEQSYPIHSQDMPGPHSTSPLQNLRSTGLKIVGILCDLRRGCVLPCDMAVTPMWDFTS